MSTSDHLAVDRPAPPFVDATFLKRLVTVCGLVPGALLVWDAAHHHLGVNEVNFAIHRTGLLGLLFLLMSLAITPLRKLTGWNVLIAPRRNLGLLGFGYVVAHFAIFFVWDRELSVASTLSEIVLRVYLWFGAAALVLLVPLALTSTDAMIARLGPVWWKRLHRLVYPIVLGGIVHFYLLVKADTSRPRAFALAFAILMAWRVVQHYVDLRRSVAAAHAKLARVSAAAAKPRRTWSGELEVIGIFDETPDVKTFRLALPERGALPFAHAPGQYLNVALTIGGKRVKRSYTIASSSARTASVEISVKRAPDGYASHHLHDTLRVGSRLAVSAPAGVFVVPGLDSGNPARVVLIAGGVGITPMMAIIRSLTDRSWPGDLYLLFAIRTPADVVYQRELEYLQQRFPNLHVQLALSGAAPADWRGARGRITREMIAAFVPDLTHGPILLCGPDGMMTAVRAILVGMGVADADILQEAFVSPVGADGPAADAPADLAAVVAAPDRGVRFARAGAHVVVDGHLTVLEAADDAGVRIPNECRAGICGQCKTRLLAGRVVMEAQDALSSAERANGVILACQAHAVGEIVVDA